MKVTHARNEHFPYWEHRPSDSEAQPRLVTPSTLDVVKTRGIWINVPSQEGGALVDARSLSLLEPSPKTVSLTEKKAYFLSMP